VSKTTKKFIESHWLTFAMKGAISVVAGMCLMFANGWNTEILIHIVGWTMIGLGLIELINMIHRSHKQANWGFPLFLGLLEIAIAIVLLITTIPGLGIEQQIPFRIATLSGYVLFASVVTIFIGFASFTNMTDRFMWIVNGMLGSVLAFVLFAGSGLSITMHIELFGTYLLINGLTDLFFGVHSHDEKLQDKADRAAKRLAAKKGKK
jgi:hypothetical protein